MAKYKLVATDMDGTFLNSNSMIPEESIKVVDLCEKMGIQFAICSGRTIPAIDAFRRILGGRGYILGANGGHIVKADLSETIHRMTLTLEDARYMFNLSQITDTHLMVWSGDTLYVDDDNIYTRMYEKLSYHKMTLYDRENPPFLNETLPNGRSTIEKMFWMNSQEITDRIIKYAPQFVPNTINFSRSGHKYIEIVDASVNKASGLEILAKHLGISMDEVVCFGDAENDIPMLSVAGMSVAMENACDSVKKIAKMTTTSNDNAGVLKALCKLLDVVL